MKAIAMPMASNLKQSRYIIFVPLPKTYTDQQRKEDAVELLNILADTLPGHLYDEFMKLIADKLK